MAADGPRCCDWCSTELGASRLEVEGDGESRWFCSGLCHAMWEACADEVAALRRAGGWDL